MSLFTDIPEWALTVSYTIFMCAILVISLFIVKTKSVFEKVLALDLLAAIVMCMAVAFSIQTKNPVFLEVSLCIAIIGFLGTVAFAKYLGRSE